MNRIAVFGNRDIKDKNLVVERFLQALDGMFGAGVYDENFVLLHGGAQGVQATIKSFAEGMLSWTSILFQPWHMVYNKLEFKPIYFYLRNKQIVQNADIVLIFTNGIKDSEVYRVINYCNLVDKPYQVVDLLPDA